MKIIGISDPHGTSKIPRGRLGNPLKDFKMKMFYVFNLASKLGNAPIICSGDVFNTPRDIIALFIFLSITYRFPDVPFYTVYGQHDMYMRNKKVLNNLAILTRAGVIKLLGNKPIRISDDVAGVTKSFPWIHLYGCNWGDKFPIPKNKNPMNILSIHAPITKEALFRGHEYHEIGNWLKHYGYYDFIIMGDIHRRHISYYKMRNGKRGVVANTGPMMRLEVTEYMKNHHPQLVIYDTEKRTFERKLIPVNAFREVLNFGIHEEILTNETLGDIYLGTKEIEEENIMKIIDILLQKAKNQKGIQEVLRGLSEEFNIEE